MTTRRRKASLTNVLNVRLPPETRRLLDLVAYDAGVRPSALARGLLTEYVERAAVERDRESE